MQVKSFSVDRKEGNIDALIKLYDETFSFIACIGHSRFECFVGGTSKTYDKDEDEQCKTYRSGIALIHFISSACSIRFFKKMVSNLMAQSSSPKLSRTSPTTQDGPARQAQ